MKGEHEHKHDHELEHKSEPEHISEFKICDLVYVFGQPEKMTVVRVFTDDTGGPMLQTCWIADGIMNLAILPEAVFRKFN